KHWVPPTLSPGWATVHSERVFLISSTPSRPRQAFRDGSVKALPGQQVVVIRRAQTRSIHRLAHLLIRPRLRRLPGAFHPRPGRLVVRTTMSWAWKRSPLFGHSMADIW